MDTLEAIFTRRSVRSFTADPIPPETLDTILRAAIAAPTGGNVQPLVYVTVQEPRRLAALRTLAPGIIGKPAAVVVMCMDQPRRAVNAAGQYDEMSLMDLGASLENILLAALALGFGGCAIGSFNKQAITTFLDLPENLEPYLLVALGKPRLLPGAPEKRPLDEMWYKEEAKR